MGDARCFAQRSGYKSREIRGSIFFPSLQKIVLTLSGAIRHDHLRAKFVRRLPRSSTWPSFRRVNRERKARSHKQIKNITTDAHRQRHAGESDVKESLKLSAAFPLATSEQSILNRKSKAMTTLNSRNPIDRSPLRSGLPRKQQLPRTQVMWIIRGLLFIALALGY